MNLKKEEIEFLEEHKIPIEKVIDVQSLNKKQYQKLMKNFGMKSCRCIKMQRSSTFDENTIWTLSAM